MKRVVSLYLPNWPIDRLLRGLGETAPPPEFPLILAGRSGRRRTVLSTNQAAMAPSGHPSTPLPTRGLLIWTV
jgi:protein ImuB